MSETKSAGEVIDVLVIGCGIAGLSTAVSARSAGAKVTVLERSVPEEFGGNTRWTEAYFRMKDDNTITDDFEERLVANAGHNIDPNIIQHMADPYENWPGYVKAHGMPDAELVSTLSGNAAPTVQWLKSFGVRFDSLPTYFMTSVASRLMPVGGGLALIEALHAHATKAGVQFRYQTTALQLLRDEGDGILGVKVALPSGFVTTLRAKSVVIASGGFEGNPEMLTQYLGINGKHLRPVARGGYYNKGEGIRMALAVGAAPAGDFGSYHAEPLDPRSTQPEALVMNFSYGVLVNRAGRRFVDEGIGPVEIYYDPISRAIMDQPDGVAYHVFDRKIDDVPNWKKSIRTDLPPLQAGSLEELAKLCEIDAAGLTATVNEFNRACAKGEFSPLKRDGLAAVGISPVKSNWARPIDSAPYFAYPIMSGACFTYGGLKINRDAQVVDSDGRVIPGLYAAGEVSGLYHQVYTGATSVLRGAVFGKIAGAHAAARAAKS